MMALRFSRNSLGISDRISRYSAAVTTTPPTFRCGRYVNSPAIRRKLTANAHQNIVFDERE